MIPTVSECFPIDTRNALRTTEKSAQNRSDHAGTLGTEARAVHENNLVPVAMRESGQGFWMEDNKAGTLRAEGENRPSRPSNVVAVPCYGIPGNWIGRKPENGGNATAPMVDISPNLTSTDRHGVCAPVAIQDVRGMDKKQNGAGFNESGTAYTVDAMATQGVAVPVAFSCKDSGNDSGIVAPTLRGMGHDQSHANGGGQVAVAFQPGNLCRRAGAEPSSDSFPTLGAATQGDQAPHVATAMQVRRLSVTECERLQGFSDGHTAGFSDSTRYKMLGNAVCVNVSEWIARRLKQDIDKRGTA